MEDDATIALDEAAQAAASLPGSIGPYRILGLLGEGGMGRVYLAREANPDREVALKVVRGVSSSALQRFRREIALLGQLEHPGIVRLYAAGEVTRVRAATGSSHAAKSTTRSSTAATVRDGSPRAATTFGCNSPA